MTEEEQRIRADFRSRIPKHSPPYDRGGPVQRQGENIAVEMVLEEREACDAALHARIVALEAIVVDLGGAVPAPVVGAEGLEPPTPSL